jgi:hypothetical protein
VGISAIGPTDETARGNRDAGLDRTTATVGRFSGNLLLDDDHIVFLGAEPNGVVPEVMAIETDRGFLIIHAMEMRCKYRPFVDTQDG